MSDQRNILQQIADRTRARVAWEQDIMPADEMRGRAQPKAAREREPTFPSERALATPGMSFICECKKASPSKGAAAISCLTEPHWFQGSDDHLAAVAASVGIPVLRKDFVVDEYMVYQAKVTGAEAVLLICSILNDDELAHLVAVAHSVGLSALVEAYEPEEVPRAIAAGARVIGVNNRDLRTFQVDFGRSIDLRPLVGPDRVFVSESGVEGAHDVARLAEAGVDAVLIGETLMRAPDKRAALDHLRSEL